ncbi:hypothetical protein DFH27DRAFT_576053 [Peziza echinospora]|nr:hypothetical protein DFH27DRAFT_576053 [Peziza echinospora]
MSPAYDEFAEKHARRPSAGNSRPLPRLRRNRRTTIYIGTVIALVLYCIWGPITARLNPYDGMDSELGEDAFAPWFGSKLAPGPLDGLQLSKYAPRHRLKLAKLFRSLTSSSAAGLRSWNQNVLFVAGDVVAARRLIVVACDMAINQQVQVHFALVGDFPATIEDLETANGIGEDSDSECKITFHDATAGGGGPLGESLGLLIDAGMAYIHRFLHPQVMIVDEESETPAFMKAVQAASWGLNIPIIELPSKAADNMRWMSKLDSGGLRSWKKPKIEIYIRSDKHHGNLERLLKSLRGADYFGILPARVTIEIAGTETLHPFTQDFIQNFGWPSRDRISIRYNILPPPPDPITQAVNHIQNFYPIDKDTSVLFLDPNVEVSPYYFHWLHYMTLEYRYSAYPQFGRQLLYGISLILPEDYVNGTEGFDAGLEQPTPFLYNVPNAVAALYFPEMWMKLHTYMRWRVKAALERKNEQSPAAPGNAVHPDSSTLGRGGYDDLLSGETALDSPPQVEKVSKGVPLGMLLGLEEKSKSKLQKRSESPLPPPPPPKSPNPPLIDDAPPQIPKYNFTIPTTPLSPALTNSWLLYLLEVVVARGATMIYPGFGAKLHQPPPFKPFISSPLKSPSSQNTSPNQNQQQQDSPDVLALLHTEIPSYFRADDTKHSGHNEPRIISHLTLLDALPGWDAPDLMDLPMRGLAGEKVGQDDLEAEAKAYRTQVLDSCPEDRAEEWLPVWGIFCED